MASVIVNGKDAVFGRMASFVAKELLKGHSAEVINCEHVIISGDKKQAAQKIQRKRSMGSGSSLKGPKYIRQSDRLVKRMIRGMLPRDRTKGQEAFKRLRCHVGDGGLSEEKLKMAKVFNHQIPAKHTTVQEIVKVLR